MPKNDSSSAVLISGGLDSAVLLAEMLQRDGDVQPIHVRMGLVWEEVEQQYLQRFLDAVKAPPAKVLTLPIADVYGDHWSVTGRDIPDAATPDEAVYLPGRNVLLLSKSLVWCHLQGIKQLSLATLDANPFADATAEFVSRYAAAVNLALGDNIAVTLPYATLTKVDVLKRGRDLPLQWTLSCMQPIDGQHCGRCNKCEERRRAFRAANINDPTDYQSAP